MCSPLFVVMKSCVGQAGRLFDNTGGPDWKDKEGWGTDAALGDWGKVDVDAAGGVVTLLLQDNGLAGSIPSELQQLRGLQAMLGLAPWPKPAS